MKKVASLVLIVLILWSSATVLFSSVSTAESSASLMVIERYDSRRVVVYAIPDTDDSMTNPHYKLLNFHWYSTANYYVNPSNKYGFSMSDVVTTITTSAETWDTETDYEVFSYIGTTTRSAGRRDGYNVVAWGTYRSGVIAVTYVWYSGSMILETDTRMNTYYKWSLTGEAGRMDVQNLMTHEFGHWAGLADLYDSADYWLTMYGRGSFGETYKRTLGLGDVLGLEAVYGP
ncbi:MAG: hypothetical protein QXR38_02900 [Nitrososphaerales archaeon]